MSAAEHATKSAGARRRVVLAVNRRSGTGRAAERVTHFAERLREQGYDVAPLDLSTAITTACEDHAAGRLQALVAAGGDGTINAVLNGTPAGLPLAVLPCGTENLLARYLRLPSDPLVCADVVNAGKRRTFDCGRVGERLFLLSLSAGFDADVLHAVERARSGAHGRMKYYPVILQRILRYGFQPLRVTVNVTSDAASPSEPSVTFDCRWCFLQNLPAYAMGLNFTPEACGDDGLLDYCLFTGHGLSSLPIYAWHVFRGSHVLRDDCRLGRTSSLRIEATEPAAQVPVQLDGEAVGYLPITIETVAGRATFLVP